MDVVVHSAVFHSPGEEFEDGADDIRGRQGKLERFVDDER